MEIALDVDNYTLGTFGNNCNAAVDWAVGVLAEVDLIYRNELNDLITAQGVVRQRLGNPRGMSPASPKRDPCWIRSALHGSEASMG